MAAHTGAFKAMVLKKIHDKFADSMKQIDMLPSEVATPVTHKIKKNAIQHPSLGKTILGSGNKLS